MESKNCFSNIDRLTYPNALVIALTKLYQFKGKDFYYEDVLKNYMDAIIKNTIEKDALYVSKIIKLNISESRTRLILKKNSEPKTNDEKILANLKNVFKIIQDKGTDFEVTSNEFLHLGITLYKGIENISYNVETKTTRPHLLEEKTKISKREVLDAEIKEFNAAIKNKNVEPTQAITNLYVDLLHLNLFNNHNQILSLIILYCLLVKERFNLFKYISFFEEYYKKIEQFRASTISAGFNWETGYSQTAMLNKDIIDMLLEGYGKVEQMIANFNFDKKIKKIDNVESAILKLGEVFTREQIKQVCPQLSDSTINRALARLKDENKVRPNGTGRSASWVRLVPDELFSPKTKQMNIFDILGSEDK